MEILGKRLGIFGMGRIGQLVATRARAFGMEIHYCNRTPLPADVAGDAMYHPAIEDLFAISDVVSLHAPSTPVTRRIVNAHTLAALSSRAILVNTARGDLVVDDALICALTTGRLAAAGLDVYDREPHLDRRYAGLDNVFLLPHLGTATREARLHMTFHVIHDLEAVLTQAQHAVALTRSARSVVC